MNVTVESETVSEDMLITRRYEDGRLVRTSYQQRFPSGKEILQVFDGEGDKLHEIHSHGTTIILTIGFGQQGKSESYIYKSRLISRETYEQARMAYPDMPSADPNLVDHNADLLKLVRLERKQQRLAAKSHQPDLERAQQSDEFCKKLMSGDQVADAYAWIELGKNSLGEMNRSESKRLVAKLKDAGCPRVFACQIDRSEPREENSARLVAELPQEPSQRTKILKLAAKLAQKQGSDPDADDGQRFLFLKLD